MSKTKTTTSVIFSSEHGYLLIEQPENDPEGEHYKQEAELPAFDL
jgi:hypothetical protein